jgi:hypothetical protein
LRQEVSSFHPIEERTSCFSKLCTSRNPTLPNGGVILAAPSADVHRLCLAICPLIASQECSWCECESAVHWLLLSHRPEARRTRQELPIHDIARQMRLRIEWPLCCSLTSSIHAPVRRRCHCLALKGSESHDARACAAARRVAQIVDRWRSPRTNIRCHWIPSEQ